MAPHLAITEEGKKGRGGSRRRATSSNGPAAGDSTVSLEEAWPFLRKLSTAAHQYGSTSIRQEAFFRKLMKRLGLHGVLWSTPTNLVLGVRDHSDRPQRIEIVQVEPPGMDLAKLARVGDLYEEIEAGEVTLDEASSRLDAIDRMPAPWGRVATLLSYAAVGIGVAALLGGGWGDVLCAMLLSTVVYGLVLASSRVGHMAVAWIPFSTAFVAGAATVGMKAWIPELHVVLVVLSAVAVLLPGFTISLGTIELAEQRIVSGMANLTSGLVYLVKQILGGWLGVTAVATAFTVSGSRAAAPVASAWMWLFVPLLILGLCVVFQASRRDLPWAFLVSGLAYVGILAGGALRDANLGNLVGTVVCVMIANSWARWTRRPTSIVLLPAIVLLVSGTIGFRGLAAIVGGDRVLGEHELLQMFVVALTIWIGLLIGNTIVRPEATL